MPTAGRTKIRVLQQDLDAAEAERAKRPDAPLNRICPVAQSLRRQGYPDPIVGRVTIYWHPDPARQKSMQTPQSVDRFISQWDRKKETAKPFAFFLRA